MGVFKNKKGEVSSVKDMNRGTVYDGPLVLMVNGLSASASEFLAAALQDYHRGIIAGARTFGKATGQEMFSLEPGKPVINFSALNTKSGFGYSTVTSEKIYRVTGKTAQQNGVKPDIVLPDIYDHLKYREADIDLALSPDSVQKKTYYQPLPLLPLLELREKSKVRVADNKGFQRVEMLASVLNREVDISNLSINWTEYKRAAEAKWKQFSAESSINSDIPTFTVSAHTFVQQRMQMDEYIHDMNSAWIKNLEGDIYLEEVFSIICDYIVTQTRK